MKFPKGTIKRIHVDKRIIAQNLKHGTNMPPITVQTSKGSHKCYRADIKGASQFVYSPKKPLGCGARLWIETRSEVTTEHLKGPNDPRLSLVVDGCPTPVIRKPLKSNGMTQKFVWLS